MRPPGAAASKCPPCPARFVGDCISSSSAGLAAPRVAPATPPRRGPPREPPVPPVSAAAAPASVRPSPTRALSSPPYAPTYAAPRPSFGVRAKSTRGETSPSANESALCTTIPVCTTRCGTIHVARIASARERLIARSGGAGDSVVVAATSAATSVAKGATYATVAAVRSIPPSYSDHPPPRATSTGNASAHTSATGHAAWRVTAARR